MGEFAVYVLGTGSLIVDVQWDLLEPFAICVVMPLLAPAHAVSGINPPCGLAEAAASSPPTCSPSCSKPQSARWSPTRSGRRSTC